MGDIVTREQVASLITRYSVSRFQMTKKWLPLIIFARRFMSSVPLPGSL